MSRVAIEAMAPCEPTELQGNSGPLMVKIMYIYFHHIPLRPLNVTPLCLNSNNIEQLL